MSDNFTFEKLFIFEMANNYMGDVDHGLRIINEVHSACKNFKDLQFAFKLQYRDLDTFIHPDYKGRDDIKYVKRFSETRLEPHQMKQLRDEMGRLGFISICSPFDEKSVDLIEEHAFDIIKIASCSFTDWQLLERIAATDKPIIASTAAASFDEIDRVVTFFRHRDKKFCLMHCVGEYPTKADNLELNQINILQERYQDIPIGFSTHESPDNYEAVKLAVAKDVCAFEKHVGIPTEKYAINDYSANPQQVKNWLTAASEAMSMCTSRNNERTFSEKELSDLRGLQRGLFAKKDIAAGDKISTENVFFAIPCQPEQVLANDMSKYTEYIATKDIKKNEAVLIAKVTTNNLREKVLQIIEKVRTQLINSKIHLPNRLDFELSHHYGIEKFEEWGATIINCINREYCKKLIILSPGQKHPVHHHKKKEETFHILHGDVLINLNGENKDYQTGDIVVVERGVKHSFSSETGAIFEEVSTTHFKDDSFYEEEAITNNKNRKTEMTFWADWLYNSVV